MTRLRWHPHGRARVAVGQGVRTDDVLLAHLESGDAGRVEMGSVTLAPGMPAALDHLPTGMMLRPKEQSRTMVPPTSQVAAAEITNSHPPALTAPRLPARNPPR